MLKERARIIATSMFAFDLVLVAAAFLLAFWLRGTVLPRLGPLSGPLYPLASYLPLLPLTLVVWGVLLFRSSLYSSHRTVSLRDEAWDIIHACAAAALLLVLIIYFLRLDERLLEGDKISRLWIFLLVTLSCLLLLGRMAVVRLTSRLVRMRGYNYRTIVIVGTGEQARRVAEAIESHRYWGFKILGFVSEEEGPHRARVGPHPVLGSIDEIASIVETQVVDEVIFALGRQQLDRMEGLLLSLEEQGIRARLALNLFPHARARVEVGSLDEIPLMTFSTTPSNELALLAKRLTDIGLSALLIAVCLPAMVLVAIALKLAYGGTVLFRQTRCGLNGRRFVLYKFRTMVEDAEERILDLAHLNEMDGPAFKLRSDPRVTRLGRILRRFSLDELPQLWNVLRGDMSLVGPRPPMPSEVARYKRWQRRRLSMRPGLTCLWQISGRSDLPFDRWMELDLQYIDSWSPLLDLEILLRTIPIVLSGRGAS